MVKVTALLALPLSVLAAAVPNEASSLDARQANDCLINRVFDSEWVEAAMTRRKVRFSGENTDVAHYCTIWRETVQYPDAVNNLQCWTDGNSGELDVSYARTAMGDHLFWEVFADTLDYWRQDTHCRTG